MKLNFDIFKILALVLLILNFIGTIAKPERGLTKQEAAQLQAYYYKQAMNISLSDKQEILSRLNQVDSLNAQLLKSEERQEARDKKIQDIDKQLKNINYEVNINWSDSSGSAVKKFLSDRINRRSSIHNNR